MSEREPGACYRNRKREAKDFEKNYICTDVLHEKRLALHRGVFYTVDYYGESRIRFQGTYHDL